jgi:hypothetical protein
VLAASTSTHHPHYLKGLCSFLLFPPDVFNTVIGSRPLGLAVIFV